jgi:hypothetical protein
MTAPFPANLAMLSSGQLLFADSSQSWDPSQFPTLPRTNLSLTAQGAASTGTISTLTITNGIINEPFEPPSVQPLLTKQFQISQGGLITFEESKVGFVSTIAAAFDASVTELQPSTIGGAAIYDVLSGTPDTITNAIAKLDAWIANAFLFQPPAVAPVVAQTNSLWGGVRWLNFNTYSVLDKFVPYVNSLVLVIGDPSTPDFCTLEITDPAFFPYKTYTSGISPQQHPLIALRIFTDFFPAGGDLRYTKAAMQTQCIRIVSESGSVFFPSMGIVAAFDYTNGTDSYTTLSVYLPLLDTSYPKDTPVPVSIAYLNNTSGPTHVAATSTIQTSTGGPSTPSTITLQGAGPESLDLQVTQPIYSDAIAAETAPYYSTYTTSYTYDQLAVANVANVGFQYGTPGPTQVPSTLSTYVGNTYTQSIPAMSESTQTLYLSGAPLVPGVVWSTSVTATNAAQLEGAAGPGPLASTLFPVTTTLPLTGVPLVANDLTQVALASTVHTTTYGGASGWKIGSLVGHDVLFLSTIAPLTVSPSSVIQFNDATYPGDQNAITITTTQTDEVGHVGQPVSRTDTPTDNDYALGVPETTTANAATLTRSLVDTQSTAGYTHYFYAADISGSVTVSTVTTTTQQVQLSLTNTRIPSFSGSPASQTVSSAPYVFSTEFSAKPSTTGILATSITSTIFISGLETASPYSEFQFDLSGVNFAYQYTASTFASAQLHYLSNPTGPLAGYSTNVVILDAGTPVTTLPFPVNTPLTLSSLSVYANENLYTDPNTPSSIALVASVTPLNPAGQHLQISSMIHTYVDTVSYPFLSQFTNTLGSNGCRVLTLVPYINDLSTSQYFMDDGVDMMGETGVGLNVAVSSFFTVTLPNTIQTNSTILYDHSQPISSIYTNYYSRELLFANGQYIHPAGFNYTTFNDGFQYPDFTYDLYNDTTFGNRYATFAFEGPNLAAATPYNYLYIRINSPSAGGAIQSDRTLNDYWPNSLTNQLLVSSMKVRMHAKLLGTFNAGLTYPFETAWVNALKQVDFYNYDDGTYDMGATYSVNTLSGGDIEYKVLINRRYYQKTMTLVRVGIAQDASQYSGAPITFAGIQVRLSDS